MAMDNLRQTRDMACDIELLKKSNKKKPTWSDLKRQLADLDRPGSNSVSRLV
jgi:hypothetical protein